MLDHHKLNMLLALVGEESQPNMNRLMEVVRNIDILALNVKAMGYRLARDMASALPPTTGTTAQTVNLASKMSTQADVESEWAAHWYGQLGLAPIYHRKLWEYAFLLQALHDGGLLRPGVRALGFGCGTEPTPSYFAAHGIASTATDLAPDEAGSQGWADTNQHATTLEQSYASHLVDRPTFDRLVTHRFVDMNAIDADLRDYDFCWSICAMEHLGSIQRGMDFLENTLETLRPGGMSIHTMEFNVDPDGPTIDNWPTVLFQRKHLEALAARLEAKGHRVAPFDFDPGSKPLDQFIDLPPWGDTAKAKLADWISTQPLHLKVAADGFVATCFGIIITKAG